MLWSLAGTVVGGYLFLVALGNWLLMRRPRGSSALNFEVLVPARNEELNLSTLIPNLVQAGCRVTVFDDDSTDQTASVARHLGALVISSREPLPDGWKGKPRACQALADTATAEWVVFLDADTRPSPDFCMRLSAFLDSRPSRTQVVTGFPKMLPGRAMEPLYLFWVPWILLATNPFGLVARTGLGHNMFLNGQFSAWRLDTLQSVRPFEAVRDEILDDVMVGRHLARKGIKVEVANVSNILSVKMYSTLSEALQGMSKNAAYVIPGKFGPFIFAALLLAFGIVPLVHPSAAWLEFCSAICVWAVVRTPAWVLLVCPLTWFGAAYTAVRSATLRRQRRVSWKGRTY